MTIDSWGHGDPTFDGRPYPPSYSSNESRVYLGTDGTAFSIWYEGDFNSRRGWARPCSQRGMTSPFNAYEALPGFAAWQRWANSYRDPMAAWRVPLPDVNTGPCENANNQIWYENQLRSDIAGDAIRRGQRIVPDLSWHPDAANDIFDSSCP